MNTKSSAEHAFWSDAINKIIKGYNDNKFEQQLIKFINELDLANISEAQKRLILADALKHNSVCKNTQAKL